MAHKSVSGHVPKHQPSVREIRIKKAHNGFMVHQEHEPAPDNGIETVRQPPPGPMVFGKHAQALKHVKGLMGQMHPPDNDADADDMQGYRPSGSQS